MNQPPFPGKDELYDLSAECIDTSLNVITNSKILDEVPIAGNLLKLIKAGASIKDYLFLRKISKFFSHVNEKTTPDERSKFAEELNKDKRKRETLYEYIFLFIDNLSEISKADLSAKVFSSFARQKIRIEELKSLYHAISQVSTTDLANFSSCFFMDYCYIGSFSHAGKRPKKPDFQVDSLISVGFIKWDLDRKTRRLGGTRYLSYYDIEHKTTELGILYAFIAEDLEDFFDKILPELRSENPNGYHNENYVFPDSRKGSKVNEISEILRVKWGLPPKNS